MATPSAPSRGPREPPLRGRTLLLTAELASPRSMMRLPSWSRSSCEAVKAAYPSLDPSTGSIQGRKVCITWKERLAEMQVQTAQLAALPGPDGLLSAADVKALCARAKRVLQREPNVVPVRAPVVVVGNVCGHYLDLLSIFALSGPVPETNYLFLGGYVNRGYDSCRVLETLLLLKVRYPQHVTLLRGTHEARQLTQTYGFYEECLRRYTVHRGEVWESFMDCLDYLPLAAIIEDRVFCVHGGLSPSVDTIDDVRAVDRFRDVPSEGPMTDLLWSDPDDRKGWSIPPMSSTFTFGEDITHDFLHRNGLTTLARSHQLVMEGYIWQHDGQCVTVFSAPNYANRCNNEGAVLEYDEHMRPSPKRFQAVPWPEDLP